MIDFKVVRREIREKAKQRYPKMRNFTLTDKAIERFLRNNDNNLEDVVDELHHHIGDLGETPVYIKIMETD